MGLDELNEMIQL